MSVENCKVLIKAKELAVERGLDPGRVVCDSCEDGNCIYLNDEGPVPTEDWFQDIKEKGIQGQANVEKFYEKLRKHMQKVWGH